MVSVAELYRYRPPSKYFVDVNRPALAKATNGWIALALYLFSLLEEDEVLREVSPMLGKAGERLAEVTKALTKTPGESLLQSLTYAPHPEPVAYSVPSFYQAPPQQQREERKGLLGRIKEALFGE